MEWTSTYGMDQYILGDASVIPDKSILAFMSITQAKPQSIKVLQPFWPTKHHADPIGMIYAGDWVMFQNLYSALVEMASSSAVRPALVERWTQSANGKRWVFYLRKNLHWSDGSVMTTEQVIQSLKRTMGGTKHTSFRSYVETINPLPEGKIEFILKKTPKNFLVLLSFVDTSILHPDAYKNEKFTWDAPNSGAFKLVSYKENEMELIANPYYWEKDPNRIQHALVVKTNVSNEQQKLAELLNTTWDASPVDAGVVTSMEKINELKSKYDVFVGNPEFLYCAFFSS